MNVAMRWCVAGSLLALLSGCSGNTELAGSSGSISSPKAAGGAQSDEPMEDARQVLATALASATENNQRVFVHIGSPW